MRISLRSSIPPLIMRLHAFLRATAAPGREVVDVGPFRAYFHPTEALKYFNYAIPDAGAEADADEIERLRAAFRERDRLPRLEWIEEAAPGLGASLAAAGMREELRTPLMSLLPDELAWPDVDATVEPVGPENLREAVGKAKDAACDAIRP